MRYSVSRFRPDFPGRGGRAVMVPIAAVCLVFGVFALWVPDYLSVPNLQQLMRDFAEPALVTLAMAIVLISRGIDLSVGSTFAMATFTALLLFHVHELPLPVVVAGVLGVGLLIGTVNGLLVTRFGGRPFLTTLAMLLILRAVYDLAVQAHTTELALSMRVTAGWELLGDGVFLGLPSGMLGLILVAVAVHVFLTRLRPGVHLRAVGSSPRAARQAGVNIRLVRFLPYLLSGLLVALAGLFYAARQNSAGSDTGLGLEITALTAAMLGGVSLAGGRGGVVQALIGAALLFLVTSGLLRMNAPGSLAAAVTGIVLLVAVAGQRLCSGAARRTTVMSASPAGSSPPKGDAAVLPLSAMPIRSVEPLVRIRGGGKRYGGISVLQGIDFDIHGGEIHALVGENGAGKSTLAKVVAGVVCLDAGEMAIDGQVCRFRAPADALRAGVAMVGQEPALVATMTVAQNLDLGREPWLIRLHGTEQKANAVLRALNFPLAGESSVDELGTAQRQLVEIARAVLLDTRVVVFDEPTSSLDPGEREALFRLLDQLRRRGVAIIFIGHALDEVLTIADRISVLRDGRLVVTGLAGDFDRDALIRYMVRRNLVADVPAREREATACPAQSVAAAGSVPLLSLAQVALDGVVRDLSFSLRAGEVLGLAGLVGAGRTDIARAIAGARRWQCGTVLLDGRAVRFRTPRQAVRHGVAYVTEDRKHDGFFGNAAVEENIHLGALAARARWRLSRTTARRLARHWVARLGVTALHPGLPLYRYSGGNQQKVAIARALAQHPRIVLLDEPTRGVDVGATEHIHATVRELAAEGKGVIVISSSPPEILALCDRILVVRAGRVVAELDRFTATEEAIMAAAT